MEKRWLSSNVFKQNLFFIIHDLETVEEWPIYDALDKDQQEAWAIFWVYPNYSWMPNNEDLVFWSGGKINRININSLKVTNIPFQVDTTIKIAKALEFETPVAPDNFGSHSFYGEEI